MEKYDGTERRKMDENFNLLIQSLKDLFNEKFDSLGQRLERLESDTKKDIESLRAGLENLFHTYDARARTDLAEVKQKLDKVEERVRALEEAPAKKAQEVQKGFLNTGKDLASKAIWGALLAFIGFLLLNYFKVL